MKRFVDLLPSYLDGPNIRAHGSAIDSVNDLVLHRLYLVRDTLRSTRPIVFVDVHNVRVETVEPILGIVVTLADDGGTVSLDVPELTNSYTVSLAEDIESVRVVTTATEYEKSILDVDSTLDVLGRLLNIVRFDGESDYDYLRRLNYFMDNFGEMNTGLLYARLVFGSENIWLYKFKDLYEENPTQWESLKGDYWLGYVFKLGEGVAAPSAEVENFIAQYLPVTRPIMYKGNNESDIRVLDKIYLFSPWRIGILSDKDGTIYPDTPVDVTLCFKDGTTYHVAPTDPGKVTTDSEGYICLGLNKLLGLTGVKLENNEETFIEHGIATETGLQLYHPTLRPSGRIVPLYYYKDLWYLWTSMDGYTHGIYRYMGYEEHVVQRSLEVKPAYVDVDRYQLLMYNLKMDVVLDSFFIHLRTVRPPFVYFASYNDLDQGKTTPSSYTPTGWLTRHYFSHKKDVYYVFKNGIGYMIMDDGTGHLRAYQSFDFREYTDLWFTIGCTSSRYVRTTFEMHDDITQFEQYINPSPEINAPSSVEAYYLEVATVTGTLVKGAIGVSGATVRLLSGATVCGTATTDNDGAFTISYQTTSTDFGNTFSLESVVDGETATASVQLVLKKRDVTLTVPSTITGTVGDTIQLPVTVVDERGTNVNTGEVTAVVKPIVEVPITSHMGVNPHRFFVDWNSITQAEKEDVRANASSIHVLDTSSQYYEQDGIIGYNSEYDGLYSNLYMPTVNPPVSFDLGLSTGTKYYLFRYDGGE